MKKRKKKRIVTGIRNRGKSNGSRHGTDRLSIDFTRIDRVLFHRFRRSLDQSVFGETEQVTGADRSPFLFSFFFFFPALEIDPSNIDDEDDEHLLPFDSFEGIRFVSMPINRSTSPSLSPLFRQRFQFLLSTTSLFFWANSLWFWFCGVFGTRLRTATQRNCDNYHLPPTTTLQPYYNNNYNYYNNNNNSVRPPAHNPYYVTSHAAAAQAVAAAATIPAAATGPFVDVVGHQAQSTIAVPVMPPGAGRSLHYHTHAATHALPQQPPLTYPNWVPFTHFG